MNNQLYDKTKELILSVETLQGRRKLLRQNAEAEVRTRAVSG